MFQYKYGEEVKYKFSLLEDSDRHKLKKFNCGNAKLNSFIQNDIIPCVEVNNEDGLMFKAEDESANQLISIVSLATSGIIFKQTNYLKVLPAIKIDVFATDLKFQKLHIDQNSEQDSDSKNHFYLSDSIMGEVIRHCKIITEEYALTNYILLYADKKAYRFYERNYFLNFESFMEKENNNEINKNIPMYMKIT